MEAASDFRPWDELIPDTLGLIFTKLSLQEQLTVVPSVCKSWYGAVTGPYCWQEIDLYDWSSHFESEPHKIERMVEMLVTRSCGSIRKLIVSGLNTERIFTFIAENAGFLRNLQLLRCNMTDSAVDILTKRLSMLSVLDLRNCITIGSDAIKTIGKNCKHLEVFCRNMHPIDTSGMPWEDDEAFAVASSMPKLKHLEMAYTLITNKGVLQILASCPQLEHLDLRGCWGVKLEDMSLNENYPKLKVLGPKVLGYYERDDWSDISNSSDSEFDLDEYEEYYDDWSEDGMWYHVEEFEGLEFRVYEGAQDAAIYWPQDP